jgi:long-chain acyl-CoA synthetase
MPVAFRLPLQVFFEREARHPRKPFLVQPVGGDEVQTLTWGEVGHQARCAAHWLRARELPRGSSRRANHQPAAVPGGRL